MQNPPRLVPVGAIALGAQPFRLAGLLRTALVAKVTLAPGAGGLELAPAEPVRLRDVHWGDDPARSLQDCSDLAPLLPHAEVLLTASAWVPRGGRVLARLGLARAGQVLLDKQAWVASSAATGGGLERVPLTWENALGGPSTPNPVGSASPRVTGAKSPGEPCGLGPIARYWPSRARLLRPEDKRGLRGEVLELADGESVPFFQAAPEDQRLASLVGDETVVLDHVHPTLPRLELRLPSVCAWYRVVVGDALGPPVAMRPDLLRVDADRGLVCLTFRAELPSELVAAPLVVACGAQTATQPLEWPRVADCLRAASPTKSARGKTAAIRIVDLPQSTLPFAGGAPSSRAEAAPASQVGTPWGGPSLVAAPLVSDPLAGTMSLDPPARAASLDLRVPVAPPAPSAQRPSSPPPPLSMQGAAPWVPPQAPRPSLSTNAPVGVARAAVPITALPRPPGLDAFELGTLDDPFRARAAPAPPRSCVPEGLGHDLLVAWTARLRALSAP
jgi:hypothetical protein